MLQQTIHKEITPLTQFDCFMLFSRIKKKFDFPLHFHEEYELNLILNAKGARRIVGDHIGEIDDMELVLVGPNLPHAWFNNKCKSKKITEITIQWHKDLIEESFLKRNQLHFIRKMFEKSTNGILFSRDTIEKILPRILSLKEKRGFDSVLTFLSILNDLSTNKEMTTLSDSGFVQSTLSYNSRRLDKAFDYMKANYDKHITLKDVADLVNMTEVSFSRFIKKRTGVTFIDSLNEIRIGHATRMLIETTHTVAEISYSCGFNNISNFNRLFKRRKGYTPTGFREQLHISSKYNIV
ncbi:MAG: AraC family transcriptional regulator [Chitinophagaceae bacterium]|nr:AraC family transcriptional regulator [Chitinophagaceae bacterium]MCW5914011.1 helix-turn-helix domain-containing protein [Chitinophagaceae bacterium]MCZ2395991.1 AraC family transcriptional regulator [Chitinophagales bacterium]